MIQTDTATVTLFVLKFTRRTHRKVYLRLMSNLWGNSAFKKHSSCSSGEVFQYHTMWISVMSKAECCLWAPDVSTVYHLKHVWYFIVPWRAFHYFVLRSIICNVDRCKSLTSYDFTTNPVCHSKTTGYEFWVNTTLFSNNTKSLNNQYVWTCDPKSAVHMPQIWRAPHLFLFMNFSFINILLMTLVWLSAR